MYRVWSKFEATRSDGSKVKLRIQDLPQNRHEDAVDLLIKYFAFEEAFHRAAGVARNPKAIEESRAIFKESMKDPASHNIICCEDNYGEVGDIVGVSSVSLVLEGSEAFEDIKVETEETQKIYELLNLTSSLYDPMEQLKLSRYYDGRGLVVHPEFRKLGIATEFFNARGLACIAHNVPATGAFMTSLGTQKAAEKANWKTFLEVNLDDLGQQCDVTFENGGVRKLMIWKVP